MAMVNKRAKKLAAADAGEAAENAVSQKRPLTPRTAVPVPKAARVEPSPLEAASPGSSRRMSNV